MHIQNIHRAKKKRNFQYTTMKEIHNTHKYGWIMYILVFNASMYKMAM